MRLSLSIQSDVLKAKAGSILNTFKIYPRRDVLFFEDILAQYIRDCEKAGFGKEMYEIGKKWSAIVTRLYPAPLHLLPLEFLMNTVIRQVWITLGLVDDLKVVRSGDEYTFWTKNEFFTRIIGENNFERGGVVAIVASLHKCDAVCSEYSQTKGSCRYVIRLLKEPFEFATKELEAYKRLNEVPKKEGVSLKRAISSGVFKLEGNQITFRGKSMLCIENSGFHLIGRSGILLDHLSEVTASFFEGLVGKDASCNSKLILLKTILESCGWGSVSVEVDGCGKIVFSILHPPYGLQAEKDNWTLLSYFVLGYLHIIDRKIVLDKVILWNGTLLLKYSGLQNKKA